MNMKSDDLERLEESQEMQQLIHAAKEQYEQARDSRGQERSPACRGTAPFCTESQRETEGRKDESEAGTARKGNF